MKFIIKTLLILIYPLFFQCCDYNKDVYANLDNCVLEIPKDTYIFPIQREDIKWLELKTTQEREAVCQLPDSILLKISTEGLICTCSSYPLFPELFFVEFESGALQSTMDYYMHTFNSFALLATMNDAGRKLLERYMLMDPDCVYSSNIQP